MHPTKETNLFDTIREAALAVKDSIVDIFAMGDPSPDRLPPLAEADGALATRALPVLAEAFHLEPREINPHGKRLEHLSDWQFIAVTGAIDLETILVEHFEAGQEVRYAILWYAPDANIYSAIEEAFALCKAYEGTGYTAHVEMLHDDSMRLRIEED